MKDIEDWMCLQINTAAALASDRCQWREVVGHHAADPSEKHGTWLDFVCAADAPSVSNSHVSC